MSLIRTFGQGPIMAVERRRRLPLSPRRRRNKRAAVVGGERLDLLRQILRLRTRGRTTK
jgi:hypothetical protein